MQEHNFTKNACIQEMAKVQNLPAASTTYLVYKLCMNKH